MAQKIGPLIKDRAFLLRSVDYGEGHRILHWLSEEHGRVHLMAFSARNSRRRSFQCIDYLQNYQIEYQAGGALGQLLQCEAVECFEKLRVSYPKTVTALQWIKILSRTLHEGINVHGVYDLLRESLGFLQDKDETFIDLVYQYLLLARLGYRLDLARCVRCGSQQSKRFEFMASEGGLLCASCHSGRSVPGIVLSQVIPDGAWTFFGENLWSNGVVPRVQGLLKNAFLELLGFDNNRY